MSIINIFITISLLFSATYFVGLLKFLSDYGDNKCEMTYMFEYPQFVRIFLKEDEIYKKYALYAYCEGFLTHKARKMHFDGIPVLFIPGNAGSYKQVRSLASVSLRKSLNSRPGFHFDYFTVDLNDELSGLNGALLYEQMEYVNHSIQRILNLYDGSKANRPKSVILFGHSMGGILARRLAISPNNNNQIAMILTLGSPHQRPPIILDKYMYNFYKKIESNNSVVPTISISGGQYDFLVPSFLTRFGDVSVVSTTVPRAWLPADHLCILWCKQLVLAINRALFDSVDIKTKQISSEKKNVIATFKHHLVKHSGTNIQLAHRYSIPINFNTQGEWIEILYRQYSVRLTNGTKEPKWYMIRLVDNPLHEMLTVVGLNLKWIDWVYACPAIHIKGQSRVCQDGIHLTQYSEIAPSVRYKRRILTINLHNLKKENSRMTHVVLYVPVTDDSVVFHVDVHRKVDRKHLVQLPDWPYSISETIVKLTPEKAINYELYLPQLQRVHQSFNLFLTPVKCISSQSHHATGSVKVPWDVSQVHYYFTESEKEPMHLYLFSPKPPSMNLTAKVKLTLDPTCRYTIKIKPFPLGVLGNLARYYSPLILANVVVVLLMAFRSQLLSLENKESNSFIFVAIKEGAKPYYVLTIGKLIIHFLSMKNLNKYVPIPEWYILENEGLNFFWLPFILYITSVGILWVLAMILSVSVFVFNSTIHKLILRVISKTFTGSLAWSDWLISGLQKLPCFVASILIIISWTTCGGLALGIGATYYFLKLTQMSQDFVEKIVWGIIKILIKKIKKSFSKNKSEAKRSAVAKQIQEQVSFIHSLDVKLEDKSTGGESKMRENKESEKGSRCKADDNKVDANEVYKDKNDSDDRNDEYVHRDYENENTGDENLNIGDENISKDDENVNIDDENESKDKYEHRSCKNEVEGDGNKRYNKNVAKGDDFKYEDNKEENQFNITELVKHDEFFFHFTIFLFWTTASALNIPSVLTWAHNFKYNRSLEPDPSFLTGFILSICSFILWQFELPRVEKRYFKELSYFTYTVAIFSLLYAPLSVYRLNYSICFVVSLTVLHQLFAPTKSGVERRNESDLKKEFDKYKEKLE